MPDGLFRASHSHNPAQDSEIMGPLPHFFLILGRVIKSLTHRHASMSWIRTFDPGIMKLQKLYGDEDR